MEKGGYENLHKKIDNLISESIENGVFSGCSLGIYSGKDDNIIEDTYHFGSTDKDKTQFAVCSKTIFDLASLTKPLVISLVMMNLVENEKIKIDEEIGLFIGKKHLKKGKITISQLLNHSSGLPAHRPYYTVLNEFPPEERKRAAMALICKEELCFEPGKGTLYSDLGFILLGFIIEKIFGCTLDAVWNREIAIPFGVEKEMFFLGKDGLEADECSVTGTCGWSKKKLCGVVHDDNCRALGGVAGHAGLFGTASAVLLLAKKILLQYKGLYENKAFRAAILRKFLTKREGSTWALGFDSPTSGTSSSGKYFSELTFGHLGFTGTSFWIDFTKEIVIVLLTNRVLMSQNIEPIRTLRPLLHDEIMEILAKKPY